MAFGIYIHIPFCQHKCSYCDFLSVDNWDRDLVAAYVERLGLEISHESQKQLWQQHGPVTSIFFGGGTPTVVAPEKLAQLLTNLQHNFELAHDTEITLEANPGTVSRDSLQGLKAAGFNRISFGVQSFNNEELKLCSRIHHAEEAVESIHTAKESGWENINLDLMYGLPGQSLASWRKSLEQAINLQLQHISAYNLIVEEGTPMVQLVDQGHLQVPEEEEDLEQGRLARELLREYGYEHYEISNYAKPGFECRHNLLYWQRQPYLGLGLGAAGFDGKHRYENTSQWQEYLTAEFDSIRTSETVTIEAAMTEFIFLGLRQRRGISAEEFRQNFGSSIWQIFGTQLEKWLENECLLIDADNIKLSDYGMEISNSVFVDFIK